MLRWSNEIGVATSEMVAMIISLSPHKEIGIKRSHGFLNLSKKYSNLALEEACRYALCNGIRDHEYIESIIKHEAAKAKSCVSSAIPLHENIRGSEQYH
jgi:hypothetical protein